eukprot:CAMPEP_0182493848 /NCGR_PEP_ID=MMETSP1321-20130603/2743_1 /TAXON_ID=91990 /ORGANISM="Bolidomonas sp., Strain RCC1657" /LENGTH=69 /DNA_ID=CAMNT_0024696727 /DNA_START=430 /DNA_END=639 /DNA_ORIENTATION=-
MSSSPETFPYSAMLALGKTSSSLQNPPLAEKVLQVLQVLMAEQDQSAPSAPQRPSELSAEQAAYSMQVL